MPDVATTHHGGDCAPGNRAPAVGVLPRVQQEGSGGRTGTEDRAWGGGRAVPAVRVLALVLLAAHLALVGWLMLRPLSLTWVYGTNVRPLATIHRVLLADPAAGAGTIVSGLVLLAPLGVLLPAVSGKIAVSAVCSLLRTVFLGASVSFAIECLQTAVPGRVFDVDSVLLNTTGVALAHLAVVPGVRAALRRRLPVPPHPGRARAGARATGKAATTAAYGIAAHRSG